MPGASTKAFGCTWKVGASRKNFLAAGEYNSVAALGQLRVSCRSNTLQHRNSIETTISTELNDVTTAAITEQDRHSVTLTELQARFPLLTTEQLRKLLMGNVTSRNEVKEPEIGEVQDSTETKSSQDILLSGAQGGLTAIPLIDLAIRPLSKMTSTHYTSLLQTAASTTTALMAILTTKQVLCSWCLHWQVSLQVPASSSFCSYFSFAWRSGAKGKYRKK